MRFYSYTARLWYFLSALGPAIALLSPPALADATIDHKIVRLQSLDKITARTITFEAAVGNTVKFGSLYIKVRACRSAPDIEEPESAAFTQIWEIVPANVENNIEEHPEWVFSGWMFASSPGLSAMDHPIYDVWVLDCLESPKAESGTASDDIQEGEGLVEEDQVPAQPDIEQRP